MKSLVESIKEGSFTLKMFKSNELPSTVNYDEGKIVVNRYITGYGSGKKTVVDGWFTTTTGTYQIIYLDIQQLKTKLLKWCGATTPTSERKPRTPKEQPVAIKTEVEKLRDSLAIARRLPKEWITIDVAALRKAYQRARQVDKVPDKLLKLSALDTEKQLRAYELLSKAGLI